jgi:uncharacterized protein (DUF488 family)
VKTSIHPGFLTFGHGTLSQDDITALLRTAGVKAVADVRSFPGSRRLPHVNRENLESWLPQGGIAYRWIKNLGGFRKPSDESAHDTVWRNESFRNYAGYTRTSDFLAGIDELMSLGMQSRTAFMCSESVWWRCHRRIISDFLVVARGLAVHHLMHDGRLEPHKPTAGLRLRDDGLIVYDGEPDAAEGASAA